MPSSKREKKYYGLNQEKFELQRDKIFNFDDKPNDPYIEELQELYTESDLLKFSQEEQLDYLGNIAERYYFQMLLRVEEDDTYEVGLRMFRMVKKVKTVRHVKWEDMVKVYLPHIFGMINFYHKELHRPEVSLVDWDNNRKALMAHIESLSGDGLKDFVVRYNRYWDLFYDAFKIDEVNVHRLIKIHDKYSNYINQRIIKGKTSELTRGKLKPIVRILGVQFSGILMQTRGPALRPSEMWNYKNRKTLPTHLIYKTVDHMKK